MPLLASDSKFGLADAQIEFRWCGLNAVHVTIRVPIDLASGVNSSNVIQTPIIFPEENHWIQKGENSRFFYKELHAWLDKYLKPEA